MTRFARLEMSLRSNCGQILRWDPSNVIAKQGLQLAPCCNTDCWHDELLVNTICELEEAVNSEYKRLEQVLKPEEVLAFVSAAMAARCIENDVDPSFLDGEPAKQALGLFLPHYEDFVAMHGSNHPAILNKHLIELASNVFTMTLELMA